MKKLGKAIVKARIPILIIGILLLVPSLLGMVKTRVNYDMLYYLPSDIETMVGQDILMEDFGKGAFSIVVVEGMSDKDVSALKSKIEAVDHVADVIWYDSVLDISIPKQLLPDELLDVFYNEDKNANLMAVFFDTTTSADETMEAIQTIRKVTQGQCYISGMSAVVTDTKNLSDQETPIYVGIAVILACIVLAIFMDSYLVPLVFMASIGMAIVYNLGTNYFLGEISYVTKALSAVLQLGVTMDYSIFLWHSYEEQKENNGGNKNEAMAEAIASTITSVVGSSITTVAGFVALCFMSFTLGRDLGIVMAKGVVFGVLGCVTLLPSMILIFDKALERTKHKSLLPNFHKLAEFIVNKSWIFLIIFVLLLGPAIYGYRNTSVYYNLDETLPKDLDCVVANSKLQENFDLNSVYMILADSSMKAKDASAMLDEIGEIDGVTFALGFNSLVGTSIPEEIIPDSIEELLKSDRYQLMLVASEYKCASDEINAQVENITDIVKKYDSSAMVIGEAPCTKDLIEITDNDFKTVSIISIGAIFLIIFCVFKSVSLPVILVAAIEFAIFINMGIPYYTKTTLPFIASIVIGTIQLGATVDYAILMTNRYKSERHAGLGKKEAITVALEKSIPSVIVSAVGFFAATFGVGLYSSVDMIGSLCNLMARGAIVSMLVVIFILPSLFVVFDGVICHTSAGFRNRAGHEKHSHKKTIGATV